MIRKPLPTSVMRRPPSHWNLIDVKDLAEELPPVPWVCEDLGLAPGPVTIVAGYGYSRKTIAMQSLALSIAYGRSAWGCWSVRRGRVVHLDYEQGRRLTQERYQRLARGMGFDIRDLEPRSLQVACLPRVFLDRQQNLDELLDIIDGATCVIVDSLRAAFPNVDEGSSDVRYHLDALARLSERSGACIVVIHHARKPNQNDPDGPKFAIRGSSALFDAAQTVFVFKGEKNSPTRVHHEKDRIRGMTVEEFALDSEDVAGPTGPRHGLIVRYVAIEQIKEKEQKRERQAIDDAANKILDVIRRAGGAYHGSAEDLRAEVGGLSAITRAAWAKLKSDGRVYRDGKLHDPIWRIGTPHQATQNQNTPGDQSDAFSDID